MKLNYLSKSTVLKTPVFEFVEIIAATAIVDTACIKFFNYINAGVMMCRRASKVKIPCY